MGFFKKVYKIALEIPEGKVATYGQIAALCGSPRAARQVGWALHKNPYEGVVPCHRIVDRFGSLAKSFAFGGIEIQKALLEKEGVIVDFDYRVDLEKYQWNPVN